MTSIVIVVVVVLAVITAVSVAVALAIWRRVGRRISREAQLLVAEQMAGSGPHQAVVGWRRALGEAVQQVQRAIDGGRRAGAAMADLESLVPMLERAVVGLDRELGMLAMEPDPNAVDWALRTDVGIRADQALQVAAQLRRTIAQSIASGNARTMEELATSTEISTAALSAALRELDPGLR